MSQSDNNGDGNIIVVDGDSSKSFFFDSEFFFPVSPN